MSRIICQIIKDKEESNEKGFEYIIGLYYSPVEDNGLYKNEKLWKLKSIENDMVELFEDESQEVLFISLDEFLKNFDESTSVLSSAEKGYSKAFRNNMNAKLENSYSKYRR